jgi:septal ring factor EnvC (AmiA/AmiB activator)
MLEVECSAFEVQRSTLDVRGWVLAVRCLARCHSALALGHRHSYFAAMKRYFPLLVSLGVLAAPVWPVFAEDSNDTAAAIAERQAAEERYKRLNSAIEDLVSAQAAMGKRLNALADELRSVREELARANNNANNYVSRADYDALLGKLKDLDEQRKRDRELILQKIQDLEKVPPVAPPATTPTPAPNEGSKAAAKGYEYRIQKGDTLATVVEAYQQKGVKVNLQQVIDANPNVNPKKLRVGQKIFIPDAALK